jgi:hypothetical protein
MRSFVRKDLHSLAELGGGRNCELIGFAFISINLQYNKTARKGMRFACMGIANFEGIHEINLGVDPLRVSSSEVMSPQKPAVHEVNGIFCET